MTCSARCGGSTGRTTAAAPGPSPLIARWLTASGGGPNGAGDTTVGLMPSNGSGRLRRHAVTEVCRDDARVRADGLGRPVGDDLAEFEDDHPVADAEHQAHVVLDEQHRLARVGEPP